MKVLIIIFSTLALSCAFPPPFSSQERTDVKNNRNARIIQQYNDNIGLGNYKFSFRSSDGIAREETAELRSKESKTPFLVVQGSYTYIGTDGLTYTVTYIADENGFRPSGLHIPKETRRT